MKLLRVLAYISIIIIIIVIGFFYLIKFKYQTQIKDLLQKEFNKQINCNVQFNNISISILKNIPNVSVSLDDLLLNNPPYFKNYLYSDTLIYLNNLYLEFNLFNFLKRNYLIKSIEANSGIINILYNENGLNNLNIFKDDSTKTGELKIELKTVKLKNICLHFENPIKQSVIKSNINKAILAGSFNKNNFILSVNGNTWIDQLIFDKIKYVNKKDISFQTEIKIKEENITLNEGKIQLADLKFFIEGEIQTINKYLDLRIKSDALKLHSFISLLPYNYKDKLSQLQHSKGSFNFSSFVQGNYSYNTNPDIKIFYQIKDAVIKNSDKNDLQYTIKKADGIFSNGIFNNSGSSYIQLNNITGKINENDFTGSIEIKNFITPAIIGKVKTIFKLSDLKYLIKFEEIEYISGLADIDIAFQIEFDNSINYLNKNNISNINAEGKLKLTNTELKHIKLNVPFQEINSEISIGEKINFHHLNFIVDSNRISLRGSIYSNINNLIANKYPLSFEGRINSQYLNLLKLQKSIVTDSANNKDANLPFPSNYYLNIKLSVDTIIYDKIKAYQVNGVADYKPGLLLLKSLDFKSFNGNCSGDFAVYLINNKLLFKTISNLKNIDIKNLFYSFNNFGQNTLLDSNISGSVDGKIFLTTEINNDYKIIDSTLNMESNLTINNGELINYEPLYKLSKYIAIEELSEVKFSTLINTVYINNRQITIPQMDINTSAFNIKFSGTHDFNNNIDYHIKVYPSEFLWRKARQNKKENIEYAKKSKNKLMIPVRIYGNIDNYDIKYDKGETLEAINTEIKDERKELINAFEKEFKSGDEQNLNKSDKKNNEEQFEIIWEEENNNNKTDTTNNSYKHQIIWDEDN